MWKHSSDDPVEPLATELARECEALLAGAYADHLRRQGRWAPPWAWVNALAHGTEEELAVLGAGRAGVAGDGAPGTRDWRVALAFLADDVLRYTRSTGRSLREVQATRLVPLELDLMQRAVSQPLNAGQLAGIVLAAVHQHPSRRQP